MYLRIPLLIISIMYSISAASDQLTFLKDTIEFKDPHFSTESMAIKNNTDLVISIDTIRYTWKIDGKTQTEPIGMAFGGLMYLAHEAVKKPDTSFCFFYQASYPYYSQALEIQPRALEILSGIHFGRCIGCLAISLLESQQSKTGQVSIRTIFINNKAGRDTVVFIGLTSDLISSGTIEDVSTDFRVPVKKLHDEDCYSLAGRKMEIPAKRKNQRVNPSNVYIMKSGRGSASLK